VCHRVRDPRSTNRTSFAKGSSQIDFQLISTVATSFLRLGRSFGRFAAKLRHGSVFTSTNMLDSLKDVAGQLPDFLMAWWAGWMREVKRHLPATSSIYVSPINFSSSSGLSVLLLLLPLSFLFTCCLDTLFLRGWLSPPVCVSSASILARSSFCWMVRVGDEDGGCSCGN
jgi:hypothetical protein